MLTPIAGIGRGTGDSDKLEIDAAAPTFYGIQAPDTPGVMRSITTPAVMTPEARTFSDRLLGTAMRRAQRAMGSLPLLRRMAHGDVVIPESAVNRVLAKAGLDAELPMHWETLEMQVYDGYFELDVQGAVKFIHGPTFRLQARFEDVHITMREQTVRIRLLREIQTFADGVVERLLLVVVQAIFGPLLEADTLPRLLERSADAFIQEEPDLVRIDIHKLRPVRRHFRKHLKKAATAVVGQETLLVRAIDCEHGELIIRTTTIAQELSARGLKAGSTANDGLQRFAEAMRNAGERVVREVRNGIAAAGQEGGDDD